MRYCFLIVLLFSLRLRLLKFFHSLQFFPSIIESDICIDIHYNTDFRMTHEVLQSLRIHSRFCHIEAINAPAYMRHNVRHLNPVNIVVQANHVVEPMLPVHCHQGIAVTIVEKKSRISIDYFLRLRWFPILNNGLERLYLILYNGNLLYSYIGLDGFNDVSQITSLLLLVIDIYDSILKANVLKCQTAKFQYISVRKRMYITL